MKMVRGQSIGKGSRQGKTDTYDFDYSVLAGTRSTPYGVIGSNIHQIFFPPALRRRYYLIVHYDPRPLASGVMLSPEIICCGFIDCSLQITMLIGSGT
jgi:hypothetical protein